MYQTDYGNMCGFVVTNHCLGVDYICILDMCSLGVRLTVARVFNFIFSVENYKMTSKTHAMVKRTLQLHIQNASLIDPLG
jgi:hypothetical protein